MISIILTITFLLFSYNEVMPRVSYLKVVMQSSASNPGEGAQLINCTFTRRWTYGWQFVS
jgi:hypothetical protein